ncbi:hypothetical protein [Piscicoccus intestinalis]|uniref:hypothetical protein n=1 Tax=Piscicoccus intestinalis TaxID=746033 RepID=UPI0012EDC8B1|nr:hypothetical protein [Piscicoccus intestinalis]
MPHVVNTRGHGVGPGRQRRIGPCTGLGGGLREEGFGASVGIKRRFCLHPRSIQLLVRNAQLATKPDHHLLGRAQLLQRLNAQAAVIGTIPAIVDRP